MILITGYTHARDAMCPQAPIIEDDQTMMSSKTTTASLRMLWSSSSPPEIFYFSYITQSIPRKHIAHMNLMYRI